MSWSNGFEEILNSCSEEVDDLEPIGLDDLLSAPVDNSMWKVFGTLDDMALAPDLLHSNLEEVDPEYRHPKHWSKEEDELLAALSEKYEQNWAIITNYFPYKKSTRVIKRWMLKHDPTVVRSRWTPEEDQFIIDWYTQFGGNWQLMSKHLKGRLPDCIKNRFYGTIKKKLSTETLNQIKINKKVYGRKKSPQVDKELIMKTLGLRESLDDLNSTEKTKRVDDLQRKMAAIEAFISKTKREIKHIKRNNNN